MTRIIRTNRKTIAIIVEKDGSLTVRAPKKVPNSVIEVFLLDHRDWIHANQAKMQRRFPHAHQYQEGETFFFLGASYPLKITDHQKNPLILRDSFYLDRRVVSDAKKVFINWYRQEARREIGARLTTISSLLGYHYKRMRITGARTRWGSCSNHQSLNFSYRLVMAPPEMIESVIIHELIHLKIPNHSSEFWKKFQELLPDYRERRKWLQENGHKYSLD